MRSRLLVVAIGAGVLLGTPSSQALARDAGLAEEQALTEQPALGLLQAASLAGRTLTYTGTQYTAAWAEGGAGSSSLVEVAHDPTGGSELRPESATGADAPLMSATAFLDPRQVALLAASYDLVVAAPGRCTGRSTHVVEARRADGSLAGRFWIDTDTGLLLRREAFDDGQRRMRSSAFVDVQVSEAARAVPVALPPVERSADPGTVATLRSRGWQVPQTLPHGFTLFQTRLSSPLPGRNVLHLAYSDGLSTLSLFAQRGTLGTEPPPGFAAEQVADRPVWVRREVPERVVWSGAGRVWTVVSDAPPQEVRAAVGALPRDAAPRTGVLARIGRGLGRMAGMVNPFG